MVTRDVRARAHETPPLWCDIGDARRETLCCICYVTEELPRRGHDVVRDLSTRVLTITAAIMR